jgi:hypothetical protein
MYKVRPVEFAAQHGACRIVIAIMNVPGVHLYKVQQFGTITYKWYDVTEYESAARVKKSPLVFLIFVDKQITKTPGFQQLHANPFFSKWCDAKFKTNMPLAGVWFLVRFCYVMCYFVYDMDIGWYADEANATQCTPDYGIVLENWSFYAISLFLVTYSACVIILDLYEIIYFSFSQEWGWMNTVEGKRGVYDQNTFYRLSNFIFACFVFTIVVVNDNVHEYQDNFDISRVICPVLGLWSLLYFVQIVPSIGSFVITIQTILGDLLNFSIIFIIMMIPFTHSFQVIVNSNTNIGCFGEYDTLFQVFYSLFSVMLNLVNLAAYDIHNINVLLFAHIVYTFTVSIMMINFFIARMSSSVSVVSQNQRVTLRIRRTLLASVVEWRSSSLLKPFHQWMMKRYFLYENDRIFIVNSESKLDS